ncbi:MAG: hypothetical protein AAF568_11935, partial [Pseudomonadota bacterium]
SEADRQTNFPRGAGLVAGGAVGLAVALVMLRTAWLGDDALITLQQVRVFVAGDGIVWNPGVRVQAFTHPLWFGLLSLVHALSGALFWPAMLLGAACTTAAVLLLWDFCRRSVGFAGAPGWAAVFALSVLLSRGFTDFGTSGLETSLSFLLAALAIRSVWAGGRGPWIWLVLAALVLTRMDNALLFGPLAVALAWRDIAERRFLAVIPGALAIIAWIAFATIYFGSPLPNTYFAKIGADYPLAERISRSMTYFGDALLRDGFSLAVILLGILSGLRAGMAGRLLALGLALMLGYIALIGGDFMRGRFLALPFFISLFLIAASLTSRLPPGRLGVVGVLAMALGQPVPLDPTYIKRSFFFGIADERGFFAYRLSAISPEPWPRIPPGRFTTNRARDASIGCGLVGEERLILPPEIWLIDTCALTDPFLSRVPAAPIPNWRPGHAHRRVPANYGEVVTRQSNRLAGGVGQELYDEMMLIATAPLWDGDRLAAIWRRLVGLGADAPDVYRTGGSPHLFFGAGGEPEPWRDAISSAEEPGS